MDEFVEVREEHGLAVRTGPGSPRAGQTDPPADQTESSAEAGPTRDALLEERGILEALSGA
jgi:hypothetical protein